ncbi:hypothetical protein TBR22_A43190 [Luteitalea sp. TBR-22]|uniref:sensor histidine kinase n=1 Tax=Luteitalea sp. TBR-22 TaxID=2802971 RepID=UPI001AF1022C|nr:sensor histidine kinase [Luteitalea sp. TBR-22]BCS35093.1 hypothetical protein TBR22_A43190 [Luteitalea sp. TBR-22]
MIVAALVVTCVALCGGLVGVALVARRRAHAVRVLSSEIARSQEQERQRLAQDLHDDVGQKLALLKLQLQMAIKADEASDPALKGCVDLVDTVIADIRTISGALKPVPFDPGLLLPALRVLAQREGTRAGLAVLVDAPGDTTGLPREVELACYRIVREALANVVKHAEARHVAVTITTTPHALTLRVADDGRGFDVKAGRRAATAGGHLGLRSVEERLTVLGGALRITSEPGVGTTLECTVPLRTPS